MLYWDKQKKLKRKKKTRRAEVSPRSKHSDLFAVERGGAPYGPHFFQECAGRRNGLGFGAAQGKTTPFATPNIQPAYYFSPPSFPDWVSKFYINNNELPNDNPHKTESPALVSKATGVPAHRPPDSRVSEREAEALTTTALLENKKY